MDEKEFIRALDEELKGTRTNRYGEFTVKEFEFEDYEELYRYLTENLKHYFDGDYWNWYGYQNGKYIKYRKRNTTSNEVYIPQQDKNIFDHSIREQLSVIRNFIYRKAKARYQEELHWKIILFGNLNSCRQKWKTQH